MAELSIGRVALLATVAGACVALGVMGAVAARAAWTVTRGHRWYQLRQL